MRAARSLKKANVKITLVDRTNHHLFQPLLYQVASSALAPRDIAFPIREILKRQKNTSVIMDDGCKILPKEKKVHFTSGRILSYDYLIVAIGTRHAYFGHPQWEEHAPGLKTLNDAIHLRNKILTTFEQAEAADSRAKAQELLTFVVVGGGPTGVELAGAIGEIAQKTMRKNFRNIDPTQSKIYLIEAGKELLPSYPAALSKRAKLDLTKIGIKVLTNSAVTKINKEGVQIGERSIGTTNIFWAAGNQAPQLLTSLETPLDKQNRVLVNADLTIPDHPTLFVIGDAAHTEDEAGNELPAIAPVAIQQGQYVGHLIAKKIGAQKRPAFRYKDKGSMATIGKARAVALIGGRQYTGFTAWALWSLIHIVYLLDFRNRMGVFMEWFWWYITEKRSSRLIH